MNTEVVDEKDNDIESCDRCRYSLITVDPIRCCKNPPNIDGKFPTVTENCWCGAFEPEHKQCYACVFFEAGFCGKSGEDSFVRHGKYPRPGTTEFKRIERLEKENRDYGRRSPCHDLKGKPE
ncbi:MAG: hypothetical protein HQM09_15145 [Candidatus Riflebacteria bacterium]|nr:hypothetical protein [Candidatus Riflebacteria bacterium]